MAFKLSTRELRKYRFMLSFGGEQGKRGGYGSVSRVRGARRMTDTGIP